MKNKQVNTTFRDLAELAAEKSSCNYAIGNKQRDIPKLLELIEAILPSKTSFDEYEVEHDFTINGRRIMLINARQIQRVLGKEQVILLAIEDITEQKRLGNLLTESEERYRHLFETASDGILFLEKSDGKITHANPTTEKILGYTNKDSIGNSFQDIGITLDMGDFQTTIRTFNISGILNYDNVPIITKSGQHIYTDISLVDRAKFVQCNIHDVTERKLANDRIRQSEERFRTIFERSTVGKSLTAPDGKLLRINQAFVDMLGYTIEEMQQFNFMQITHPDDVAESRECIRILLAGEQDTYRFEKRYIHKNSNIVWVDLSTTLLRDEKGMPLYLITNIVDITDRKQAEEQLKHTLDSLRKAFGTTIQVMVAAVETRDPYTSGHQIRSADIARAIATEMELPQDQIEGIRMAGSIHDIGKLSIPAEILSKPGKLSELEFSLVKEHARKGFEMLKDVESPWPLAEIVYEHHERMDGSGYPRGLKGEYIIIEARIMAVADVVESMASHRPYRPALGINAALEEIEKNREILYDADVSDACLKLFREKDFQIEGT